MKTTLHTYTKSPPKEAKQLPTTKGELNPSFWSEVLKLNGQIIELPEDVFKNRFEGFIPFIDYYQAGTLYLHLQDVERKQGYFLALTEEMRFTRRITKRCNKCEGLSDYTSHFCLSCIDSGTLEENEIWKAYYTSLDLEVNPKNIHIPSLIRDRCEYSTLETIGIKT